MARCFWIPIAAISLVLLSSTAASSSPDSTEYNNEGTGRLVSAFPVIMCDSDVGLGLGEKGVVRNQLGGHQAFALALSSDRILMSNFFGFGNSTPDTNEQFPRASHALALVFSRGFTRNLVGEIGQSATWGRVWDYPAHLNVEGPFVESNRCQNICTVLATCWDSRDHPINPAHGFHLRASGEVAAGVYFDNPASTRG